MVHWAGYAVDLFFVLSGFILNWVYLSHAGSLHWPSYFWARVARIIPLYYLTTLVFLPIPLYSLWRHGTSYVGDAYPAVLLSNFLMVSGILDGFHHTINIPAWSIGVEFFCYVSLFPLLVLAEGFLARKRYGVAVSMVLVLVLSHRLALCYQMTPIAIYHWSWDSSWLARGLCGFSLGFFLCFLYRTSAGWKPRVGLINLMLLASLGMFILTLGGYVPFHLLLYAFPVLVFFSAFDRGMAAVILKLSTFQWLGERSFSIYLWHMPVLTFFRSLCVPYCSRYFNVSAVPGFVKLATVTGVVLAVSEISYRYFESPCRKQIRRLSSGVGEGVANERRDG